MGNEQFKIGCPSQGEMSPIAAGGPVGQTGGLWKVWTLIMRNTCWLYPRLCRDGRERSALLATSFLRLPYREAQPEPTKPSSPAHSSAQCGTGFRAATTG